MKVLIITSSPNADGLTAACGEAARQGVVDGSSPARVVDLNDLQIARCAVHKNGWGTCRDERRCQMEDDFQSLQTSVEQAEGYVFVTPVYFGEPSEPMRAFLDRLRRCEAIREPKDQPSRLSGKPAVCIAAAGGSGHGTLSALSAMERALAHMGADCFDVIPVTRRTREYQLETIHDALVAMTTAVTRQPSRPAPQKKRRGRGPRRRHP